MKIEEVKDLLAAISRTLEAIKGFPVFEEVVDENSYYTMSDLTIGDAIQALDEVVVGIENINDPDLHSDLCLTTDLGEAIASLSQIGTSVILADAAAYRRNEG